MLKKELLFVYNANSNVLHKYIDAAHKIISPSTYACDLCSLTHGNFSEKKAWKEYKESTNHLFTFHYKNDFLARYADSRYESFRFPVILEQKKDGFDIVLDAKELKSVQSVKDLIRVIEEKVDVSN